MGEPIAHFVTSQSALILYVHLVVALPEVRSAMGITGGFCPPSTRRKLCSLLLDNDLCKAPAGVQAEKYPPLCSVGAGFSLGNCCCLHGAFLSTDFLQDHIHRPQNILEMDLKCYRNTFHSIVDLSSFFLLFITHISGLCWSKCAFVM